MIHCSCLSQLRKSKLIYRFRTNRITVWFDHLGWQSVLHTPVFFLFLLFNTESTFCSNQLPKKPGLNMTFVHVTFSNTTFSQTLEQK